MKSNALEDLPRFISIALPFGFWSVGVYIMPLITSYDEPTLLHSNSSRSHLEMCPPGVGKGGAGFNQAGISRKTPESSTTYLYFL